MLAQDFFPEAISFLVCWFEVDCSVNLNYQSRIVAKEIGNKWTNGMLSPKFPPMQISIT
jgi:hypothetical protein